MSSPMPTLFKLQGSLNKFPEFLRMCTFIDSIGLYTPINYFGRYATCSHKDGGRSMFSLGKPLARRTTWYAYNYVGARKFKSCVLSHLQDGIFYYYVIFKHPLSLWLNFFVAATPSLWPIFFAAATLSLTKILRSSNTMPRRHSYTRTMRRFPVSEKLPVSNHRKRTF